MAPTEKDNTVSEPARFTEDELALIADKEFFRRKLEVSEKIRAAFTELRNDLLDHMKPERYLAPQGVDFTEGKLSGGEKHYDLPYLFLDFPRRFSREFIFAYRSIFWWGHHFLFTLILSGEHLSEYQSRAFAGWDGLAAREDWIAVTPDPFEWRRGEEFFRRIRPGGPGGLEDALRQLPFLKLIHFVPFDDPRVKDDRLVQTGFETFRDWEFVISR